MTTISSLIQTLTTILANHGDFAVTVTNDATGELRYVDGIDVSEDLGEINLTHVSFGEMLARDNGIELFADDEFFIAEVDASMTDEEFLQALALLGLCDGCAHSNQFTLDDVASCNCCEDYSYYTPKSRY